MFYGVLNPNKIGDKCQLLVRTHVGRAFKAKIHYTNFPVASPQQANNLPVATQNPLH